VAIGGAVLWVEVNCIQQFVHNLAFREESAAFGGESAQNLERAGLRVKKNKL